MAEQNFKNHIRLSPLHHFVIYPLLLALLIGSARNFYQQYQYEEQQQSTFRNLPMPNGSVVADGGGFYSASLILLISILLLLIALAARSFALKAQDRAIRAEENLRYFAITGKLMDNSLTMGQIIALRFAPNNELMDLAHLAVEKRLSPRQIKQSIKNWRADHYRV
jgi:hypothetical protein